MLEEFEKNERTFKLKQMGENEYLLSRTYFAKKLLIIVQKQRNKKTWSNFFHYHQLEKLWDPEYHEDKLNLNQFVEQFDRGLSEPTRFISVDLLENADSSKVMVFFGARNYGKMKIPLLIKKKEITVTEKMWKKIRFAKSIGLLSKRHSRINKKQDINLKKDEKLIQQSPKPQSSAEQQKEQEKEKAKSKVKEDNSSSKLKEDYNLSKFLLEDGSSSKQKVEGENRDSNQKRISIQTLKDDFNTINEVTSQQIENFGLLSRARKRLDHYRVKKMKHKLRQIKQKGNYSVPLKNQMIKSASQQELYNPDPQYETHNIRNIRQKNLKNKFSHNSLHLQKPISYRQYRKNEVTKSQRENYYTQKQNEILSKIREKIDDCDKFISLHENMNQKKVSQTKSHHYSRNQSNSNQSKEVKGFQKYKHHMLQRYFHNDKIQVRINKLRNELFALNFNEKRKSAFELLKNVSIDNEKLFQTSWNQKVKKKMNEGLAINKLSHKTQRQIQSPKLLYLHKFLY